MLTFVWHVGISIPLECRASSALPRQTWVPSRRAPGSLVRWTWGPIGACTWLSCQVDMGFHWGMHLAL